MHDNELSERVAVMESREESISDRIDKIEAQLAEINRQITRFHGAAGMLAFFITGIGVAWGIFGDAIKRHWQ